VGLAVSGGSSFVAVGPPPTWGTARLAPFPAAGSGVAQVSLSPGQVCSGSVVVVKKEPRVRVVSFHGAITWVRHSRRWIQSPAPHTSLPG